MGEAAATRRNRDPARSRAAILDAAEMLFAESGYEATTLQAVGRGAGVSRGTAGYFFGSKRGLYEAVLDRAFADELDFVARARAVAMTDNQGPEGELAAVIESLIDFLAARPHILRLIEREALGRTGPAGTPAGFPRAMQGGLALAADLLVHGPFRPVDPAQIVLDVISLCWFPFIHTETFVRGLGLDPEAASFVTERKRHVVEMVLRGIRTESNPAPDRLPPR